MLKKRLSILIYKSSLPIYWCMTVVGLYSIVAWSSVKICHAEICATVATYLYWFIVSLMWPALFAFTVYCLHPRYDNHREIHFSRLSANLFILIVGVALCAIVKNCIATSSVYTAMSSDSVWVLAVPGMGPNIVIYPHGRTRGKVLYDAASEETHLYNSTSGQKTLYDAVTRTDTRPGSQN